ncbi:MAG: hypothetical protein WBV82_07655 [Myxococcaceae bacterium]
MRSSSEPPPGVYEEIRSALTRGLDNWAIDQGDVDRVHRALAGMTPAQYRGAVERMERDRLLERYLDEGRSEGRDRFLEQATSKGLASKTPGARSSGPQSPPDGPDTLTNPPELSPSVRRAINDFNIRQANGYYRAYDDYTDRYVQAVGTAKNGAELRELGPPAKQRHPSIAIPYGDPMYGELQSEQTSRLTYSGGSHAAQIAVSNRLSDFRGEAHAGSVWATVGLGVEVRGTKVGGETVLGNPGRADKKTKLELETPQFTVSHEVDATGAKKQELKVGVTTEEGSLKVGASSDGSRSVSLELAGLKVENEYDKDGRTTRQKRELLGNGVTVGDRSMELRVGSRDLAGVGWADLEKATFGGRMEAKLHVSEEVNVEAKLGYGLAGITAEAARHALDPKNPGVWEIPRELEAGIAWEKLDERTRSTHERNNWTREEWQARLKERMRTR